jgi:uncharacterized damage-inducible protein DinB
MIISSIKSEFQRYKELAEGTFEQVPEEALSTTLGDDNNSISIIVAHLSGNLKSRFTDFLTTDGEKPWRMRDKEFEEQSYTKAEMIKVWNEGWDVLLKTLNSLTDESLDEIVTIRGMELKVVEALHLSLAHLSYHVGQIVFIGRSIAGCSWKSLSIPKGESQEYNKNPKKER